MEGYSDNDMLRLVNERTEGSYKAVHGRYFRVLFVASVRITRNPSESEDIVNEVFIRLYTRYSKANFESWGSLYTHLLISTKNRSINYAIRSPRSKAIPFDEAVVSSICSSETVADALELKFWEAIWAIRFEKTVGVIESLPHICILVVKMVYLDRLTTREIAAKLDIKPQTVLNHKTKGLAMLAKILREEDFAFQILLIMMLISAS